MDGIGAFPDENTTQREYGDEFACVGLQYDPIAQHLRNRATHSGYAGVIRPFFPGEYRSCQIDRGIYKP